MTAPGRFDLATELRRIFAAHPSGVVVVAARLDGVPVGFAASTFVPVSLDPPLVSICTAHTSTTWPRLRTAPRLGISVLAAGQTDLARRFGATSADRFTDVDWAESEDGAVLLPGSAAHFRTAIEQVVVAGDHDIVVLRIHDGGHDPEAPGLVFHRSRLHPLP